MLVLILIAVWIAILAPVAIRRFRDRDTDRSIVNFHERMARLGERGDPIVEPAHRLDVSRGVPAHVAHDDEFSDQLPSFPVTPRLRVVPSGAPQASLNREMTWDEWPSRFLEEPVHAAHAA